ncbi:MAG TPA: GGDEF domain-containing protein [Symbiobacteriaceae bacterium]|nr:GGDEF domain-containing protein [Symbiobacteriaceae bacterium]
MWSKLPLRIKLTILVVTAVAVSSYLFGRFTIRGITDMLDKVVGERAEAEAHALVELLAAEAPLRPTGLQESEFYNSVTRLVQSGFLDRVEVLQFLGDREVHYMLNVPADGSEEYSPAGTVQRLEPGKLYEYIRNNPGHHAVNQSTGPAMAGWAYTESEGVRQGFVVVFIDGEPTSNLLESVSLTILIVMLVFVLLSGLVAYKFSTTFEKTAVTDGLMGIYNHKFFKQRLEQEVAKSARYAQQTSLVMCDIDFFKRVNDTYGHATGDLTLKHLARWVTETARNTDVVARYGGEEIAIILTHTGVAGAQEFAERLRLKVSQQVIKDPEEDAEFRVTISVGVAQWEKGVNMLDLIKRADAALYHSKRSGRNRVTIYQEDILPAPEPQTKTGT